MSREEEADTHTRSSARKKTGQVMKKSKEDKKDHVGPAENTPLWRCLQDEDVAGVQDLVAAREGGDVNMRDSTFGWTPTLFAANNGSVQMLKVILDAKAKAEATCNEGNAPLMVAARRDNRKAVEYLLGRKVNMDAQNNNGWTALMWSCINGHEELAIMLMAANADYNKADAEGRTACMWAARHGYLGIVEALLACGLNLDRRDEAGMTVMDHAQEHMEMRSIVAAVGEVNKSLLWAARRNDINGVREALEAGAYVDLRDAEGWTALMYAALHQSLDMVQFVVRQGANPSLLDQHGDVVEELNQQNLAVGEALYTVLGSNERLLQAAKEGDWDAVDLELQIGAWVNVRDETDKRSALMWAARHGSAYACGSLCARGGCAIDEQDSFGWAACHFAVSSGSLEAVSMLHHNGANFGLKTFQGDTCLHIAVRANDSVMMQMLLAGKADIEATDVEGYTSLQISARSGLPESLRTMLAYSADVSARDKKKRSSFHLAIIGGHEDIVEMMLQPLQPPAKFPPREEEARAEDEEEVPKSARRGKAKDKGESASKDKDEKEDHKKKDEEALSPRKSTKKDKTEERESRPKAKAKGAAARASGTEKVVKKKEAVVKKETTKVGDHPLHLLELAQKKREAMAKVDKNPLGKAALKQVDGKGKSSLALAVKYMQPTLAALLLEEKANIEDADDDGITVLMEAVITKQRDVVSSLLELKCKVDKKTKNGKIALDLCKDAPIQIMLQRVELEAKLAAKSAESKDKAGEDGGKQSAKAKAGGKKKKAPEKIPVDRTIWRIRIEALPTKLMYDVLEEQLRALIRKTGAPEPVNLEVPLDPITARPRGWAYCDYYDAAAAEIIGRADGEELLGHAVRVVRDSIWGKKLA